MKKNQNGFTLIELVMVIVVLGVLSAVAIPKYVDFKVDAANAATKGVAGALASASAINYAANKLNPPRTGVTGVILITDCNDISLLTTTPPSNFSYGGSGGECTVTNSDGGTSVTWNMSN